VQTQRLGNGVDEGEVGHRRGHNVAEVEADKVPVAQHGTVRRAANLQQDQEDEGDEEEEGREQGGRLARARGALELGFCEFGVGLDGCGARVVGAAPPEERHGGRMQVLVLMVMLMLVLMRRGEGGRRRPAQEPGASKPQSNMR
jgi:hypothetical protein